MSCVIWTFIPIQTDTRYGYIIFRTVIAQWVVYITIIKLILKTYTIRFQMLKIMLLHNLIFKFDIHVISDKKNKLFSHQHSRSSYSSSMKSNGEEKCCKPTASNVKHATWNVVSRENLECYYFINIM